MEEFKLKTWLRIFYWTMIVFGIGIMFFNGEYGVKICFGLIILLLVFLMNRKIIIENDKIIEKTLFKNQTTLFSEITSMKIKTNSALNPVNQYLYFLELEKKNNKKDIVSEIYTYKNHNKILTTLEKKTNQKIQIIKRDFYFMDCFDH